MALDPQVVALLEQVRAAGAPPLKDMPVAEARARIEGLTALMGPAVEVERVERRSVPGANGPIELRLYRPDRPASEAPPVIVYLHGGGWMAGSVDLVDPVARALAADAGSIVVSVGYGLAPERPFPAGAEDAYTATVWVQEHALDLGGDPGAVVLLGDSAGGNLAAAVTLMARDRARPPVALQVLLYPVTDASLCFPSCTEHGTGYLLQLDDMRHFWRLYLDGADGAAPYASVLRAADLSGLPPAFVATCEYDLLRDEGEAYARRLAEAGTAVELRRYPGQPHALLWLAGVVDAAVTLRRDVAGVVRALARPPTMTFTAPGGTAVPGGP